MFTPTTHNARALLHARAIDVQASGHARHRTAQSQDGLVCCHVQSLQETQLHSLQQQIKC